MRITTLFPVQWWSVVGSNIHGIFGANCLVRSWSHLSLQLRWDICSCVALVTVVDYSSDHPFSAHRSIYLQGLTVGWDICSCVALVTVVDYSSDHPFSAHRSIYLQGLTVGWVICSCVALVTVVDYSSDHPFSAHRSIYLQGLTVALGYLFVCCTGDSCRLQQWSSILSAQKHLFTGAYSWLGYLFVCCTGDSCRLQ